MNGKIVFNAAAGEEETPAERKGRMTLYRVVTIEREYASGGNEIGKRLAKELGYKFYDRNILMEAAKNLGTPAIYIENLEETSSGGFLFNLSKTPLGGGNIDESRLPMAEKLFLEEKRIIEKLAEEGSCVVVGRAAGYLLREREDCLRVFLSADKEMRIKRAVEKEGVKKEDAENVLKKNDKRRSGFYDSVTNWKWGNPKYFEICLDSGKLGIELCTEILAAAVRKG